MRPPLCRDVQDLPETNTPARRRASAQDLPRRAASQPGISLLAGILGRLVPRAICVCPLLLRQFLQIIGRPARVQARSAAAGTPSDDRLIVSSWGGSQTSLKSPRRRSAVAQEHDVEQLAGQLELSSRGYPACKRPCW